MSSVTRLREDLEMLELDAAYRDGKGLPPRDRSAELGVIDTDMANARRLVSRSGGIIRHTPEAGWICWDDRRWCVDEVGRIQALAKDAVLSIFDEIKDSRFQQELFRWARKSQSVTRINAMIELAKSEPGIPARLTDFDADPMLLNVANGTLDLRTGKLRDHKQDDHITRITSIPWDEKADFDLWDKFLWRVLGQNRELYDYVQRAVGYTLTGRSDEQCLFFLYGTGANGKSVFEETLAALLGEYGTATRTETIMQRGSGGIPNDIAALRGARYVSINETADGQRINEPLVKDMTGGDTMSARFMRQEFFTFRPCFKLWIRGNHKPVITGTDYGIWRRIHLIPFIVTIPESDRDSTLLGRLREELPGILRWAVEGCLAWQRDGLKPPLVVTSATAQYRREMDVLGAFLEDRCTLRQNGQVTAKSLYRAYREWCDSAGEHPVNQRRFGIALQERGISKEHTRGGTLYHGIELEQPNGWQGRD